MLPKAPADTPASSTELGGTGCTSASPAVAPTDRSGSDTCTGRKVCGPSRGLPTQTLRQLTSITHGILPTQAEGGRLGVMITRVRGYSDVDDCIDSPVTQPCIVWLAHSTEAQHRRLGSSQKHALSVWHCHCDSVQSTATRHARGRPAADKRVLHPQLLQIRRRGRRQRSDVTVHPVRGPRVQRSACQSYFRHATQRQSSFAVLLHCSWSRIWGSCWPR